MNEKPFALITGASSGIGMALAREFARRHINLLLVALPSSGLEEVACTLRREFGVIVNHFTADLTDPSAPQHVLNWCLMNNYQVKMLVNNAGFGNHSLFEETDLTLMTRMIALNNHALISLTYLFIPLIRKNLKGYIMNVGSLASFLPIPNKSVYSATKSFVYSFSSALRMELKPYRIHVCCLCPGATVTSEGVVENIHRTRLGARRFVQMPSAVASEAVGAMFQRRRRIIPGWHNKVLFMLRSLLPEAVTNGVLQYVFNNNRTGMKKRPVPQAGIRLARHPLLAR